MLPASVTIKHTLDRPVDTIIQTGHEKDLAEILAGVSVTAGLSLNRISTSQQIVARNLKFSQISAIIFRLINTRLGGIDNRLDNLQNTVHGHGQRLDRIDGHLATLTSATNNINARAANANARDDLSPLVALDHPEAGNRIPNFPCTYGAVDALTGMCIVITTPRINTNIWTAGRELTTLLRALNVPSIRNAERKGRAFFRAIGVVYLPAR
ncbi:Tropomyosin domain-containing protein [Fusarium mundagurra]|uniref:Tropomyosin domain-containing protein n=1 Tax=Fusarium mundagurra TaxID=1567541 RepID=A0A8H5Y2Z3_9HYPO|nr:Tropomyosin domain-containing protein [Fusarium mundagurra]